MCLDDSKEGWATRRGDDWEGDPPPALLRQMPSFPASHFLASVLGLRPLGKLELDDLDQDFSDFSVPVSYLGILIKFRL